VADDQNFTHAIEREPNQFWRWQQAEGEIDSGPVTPQTCVKQ
jgi:hypothetical protein